MPTRRGTLATAGSAAGALLAGCTGLLFGEGATFEATAPSVSDAAASEAGYEHQQTRDVVVERTYEAAGESRTVEAVNWQAEYDKTVDLGGLDLVDAAGDQRAATFSALTSPKVEILGQTFNPIAEMDAADIVAEVQGRYDQLGNLRQVGSSTATLLGQPTPVGEFEGEARLTGADLRVDLTMHVAEAVESGDDFAVAVAAYPSAIDDLERDDAFRMLEGVQHGE